MEYLVQYGRLVSGEEHGVGLEDKDEREDASYASTDLAMETEQRRLMMYG